VPDIYYHVEHGSPDNFYQFMFFQPLNVCYQIASIVLFFLIFKKETMKWNDEHFC
jgi:hypothetical protein